jgi:hypothetical protein
MYLYRCLYFFGIFGPMIASLFIWLLGPYLFFGTSLELDPLAILGRLTLGLGFAVFFLIFALLMGIVPGLATGLVYWLLKTRTNLLRDRKRVAVPVMGLIGGMFSGLFALVGDQPTAEDFPFTLFGFVVPGIVAAAICALLLERKPLSA